MMMLVMSWFCGCSDDVFTLQHRRVQHELHAHNRSSSFRRPFVDCMSSDNLHGLKHIWSAMQVLLNSCHLIGHQAAHSMDTCGDLLL